MKLYRVFLVVLTIIPSLASAQQQQGLQSVFRFILQFVNTVLIPFILGIAFLFFVWNAVRYFVFEGASEDGREKAKDLALYSLLAFVVIVIFWGMVNFLSASIGLGGVVAPPSDYVDLNKNS